MGVPGWNQASNTGMNGSKDISCVLLLDLLPILPLQLKESVGSSNEELSSWSNIFAGVLCDLGIDPEEEKKKVITIDPEPTSKKGGSSRAIAGASEKGSLRFRKSNLEG
ncbi:hypothetical protein Hanom_Chr12g01135891 [Helianthus anomalus]